jgi:hypothetical protein
MSTSVLCDVSFLVFAPVTTGQDVNDNGDLIFDATSRSDTGWAHAGGTNSFAYTGSPDHIHITIMVKQTGAGGRANPTVQLLKNGNLVAESATGYIRNGSGHNESSNTIAWIDPNPGTNPTYTLVTRQESNNGTPILTDIGHFSGKAVEKILVKVSL